MYATLLSVRTVSGQNGLHNVVSESVLVEVFLSQKLSRSWSVTRRSLNVKKTFKRRLERSFVSLAMYLTVIFLI